MNRKELIANVDKVYKTASRYSDRGRIIGEKLGIDCNLDFKTDFSNRENYSFEWHWSGSQETNSLKVKNGIASLDVADIGPLDSMGSGLLKSEIAEVQNTGDLKLANNIATALSVYGSRMILPLLTNDDIKTTFFNTCATDRGVETIEGSEYRHISGPPYTYEFWVGTSDFTIRKVRCSFAFIPFGDAITRTLFTVGALVTKPFDAASSDMLSKWSKKFADLYYYVDELTIEADPACQNDTPSEAL